MGGCSGVYGVFWGVQMVDAGYDRVGGRKLGGFYKKWRLQGIVLMVASFE